MKLLPGPDFTLNWAKWRKNTSDKDSRPLMALDENKKPEIIKAPLTPFRRNRGRLIQAPPDNTLERTPPSNISPNTLKIQVISPSATLSSISNRRRKNHHNLETNTPSPENSGVNLRLQEIDKNSSEEISPICSPVNSLRSSSNSFTNDSWRGSPSQRSQDSGYSDSGESNVGYQNDVEDKSSSVNETKHITRVYFGDHSQSSCENENTIPLSEKQSVSKSSQTPPCRIIKTAKRRSNSVHKPLRNVALPEAPTYHYKSTSNLSSRNSYTQTTSRCENEMERSELEHKSLIDCPFTKTLHCSTTLLPKNIQKPLFQPNKSLENLSKLTENQPRAQIYYQNPKTSSRIHRKISQGRRTPRRIKNNDKRANRSLSIKDTIDTGQNNNRRWSSDEVVINSAHLNEKTSSTFSEKFSYSTFHVGLHQDSPFQIAKALRNDSLSQWLGDLHLMCESECMNTLQSKSVPIDSPFGLAAQAERSKLTSIQERAHVVSGKFALLCQRLEVLQLQQLPEQVRSLVKCVDSFTDDFCRGDATNLTEIPDEEPEVLPRQVKVIDQICNRLLEISTKSSSISNSKPFQSTGSLPRNSQENTSFANAQVSKSSLVLHKGPSRLSTSVSEADFTLNSGLKCQRHSVTFSTESESKSDNGFISKASIREFVQVMTALGHAFTKLVDILLTQSINIILAMLRDTGNEKDVEMIVYEISELGISGGHVCRLFGRLGGVESLIDVCRASKSTGLKPQILRCLATVCCVAEGITAFVKGNGLEFITAILCDSASSEEIRSEAAGVLAQITSPWVESSDNLPNLADKMGKLIKALTDLASCTESSEVFFLTTAALANLTFLDSNCVDEFLSAATHDVLLRAAREQKETLSIFTKDQIATVIANMTNSLSASEKIVKYDGVDILTSLLSVSPLSATREAEIEACERVQQKSAIALSRISSNAVFAKLVVSSGAVERLVHLCKNEVDRNQSDAVLVACLAALRKVTSWCGVEEMAKWDATELVQPKLLDSFLKFSSQQESFV